MSTIDKYPDQLGLARNVSDILRLRKQRKVAVILGIEGGHAIEDDLAVLRMFYRIGVRVLTLTWMVNTNWADSSGDDPKHRGLTPFGKQVVKEMNRLGMVVDVSHLSDSAFYDVLATTTKPVIASHSGCRAVCQHHRNLSDRMLRALCKNGGIIGINYFTGFLDIKASQAVEAYWNAFRPK